MSSNLLEAILPETKMPYITKEVRRVAALVAAERAFFVTSFLKCEFLLDVVSQIALELGPTGRIFDQAFSFPSPKHTRII